MAKINAPTKRPGLRHDPLKDLETAKSFLRCLMASGQGEWGIARKKTDQELVQIARQVFHHLERSPDHLPEDLN